MRTHGRHSDGAPASLRRRKPAPAWRSGNRGFSEYVSEFVCVCVVPADDQTVNSVLALNLVLSWSVQRVDKHSFFIPATNQELAGHPRQAPRSFREI